MRCQFLFLLLLLALVPAASFAQGFHEDIIPLRHIPPTRMVERLDMLAGSPENGGRVQFHPDDAQGTLRVRVIDRNNDKLETERYSLTIYDAIVQMDRPEPRIRLNLYLVQSNLLSDSEFLTLDRTLREKPLKLERGTTAKGVVFQRQMEVENQQFVNIDEAQAELRGASRPEPVQLKGRLLPSARPDGRIYLHADLVATAMDRPFAEGKEALPVNDRAVAPASQPLIITSGKELPLDSGRSADISPRHEVMLYIWAQSIDEKR